MTSTADSALTRLRATLADFNAFLEEEAAALAGQDTERLGEMLPRREALHRELASHWLALAQAAGAAQPKGLADLRQRLFGPGQPSEPWLELEALVHASDRLNQVNGRLIEEQMRRTQVALQVLRNSLASHGIYGADGRVTDIQSLNRRIDSA